MKISVRSHIAVSIFFLIFLLIPLSMTILSRTELVSQAEKRKLADFPQIKLSRNSIAEFPKKFEQYIEDHFGFRNNIVRLHNYTLCKIFHVSPSGMVTVGRNNWYYYNGDAAMLEFLGQIKFSKVRLEKYARVLKDRDEWLKSMGSNYLFIPVPNKEAVYPEYLPSRLRMNAGPSKYDQITHYLYDHSVFRNFLDVKQIMLENKQDQLFLQTDSHWNNDGVFVVYLEIIKRLQQWFPDIVARQRADERKWVENYSGDLATLMNLRGLITERAPDVNLETQCKLRDGQRLSYLKKFPEYAEVPLHRFPVEDGCNDKKFKIMLIHDSFGKFLKPFLSPHFETVIYNNYFSFEMAKTIIKHEKPDAVLDLRVGRNLQKSLYPDPELEQWVLHEKFARLTGIRTSIDRDNWQQFVITANEAITEITGNGVKADFPKPSSSLVVTIDNPDSSDDNSAIRFDIQSSQESSIQFCYQPEGNKQKQCEERQVKRGGNELFMRVFDPAPHGTLAINPLTAGKYVIKSIIAVREN